jgi:hypothetical protein
LEPPEALAALDAEPPDAEAEQEHAAWRVQLAERRMREVHLALEEAELQGAPVRDLEPAAAAFDEAVAVYEAAVQACAAQALPGDVEKAAAQRSWRGIRG